MLFRLLTRNWRNRGQFAVHKSRFSTESRPIPKSIQGWTCTRSTSIKELSLTAFEYNHSNSKAKLLRLRNDDDSDSVSAFSVGFRTTPMDSTGVAHILEHVTLCGSKNYPVKDPFFKMLDRSLATFMNAMTGPDYTFYPFATPNKNDFFNLLRVYLDAVFRPTLHKDDFLQEGWRLEGDRIQGVVFNEMKGVFADPQQLFQRHLLSKVLPGHTYGFCSGGIPEKIPDLTYEDLVRFHRIHYNPDNAKFIVYGGDKNVDMDDLFGCINEYLDYDKVLGDFEPQMDGTRRDTNRGEKAVSNVPNEIRWSEPKEDFISCPLDPTQPNNSTLAMTFLTADINDDYETFVLYILSELLLDGANAPFYKSLLESGLGSGFAPVNGFGDYTKDTLFSVGIQGMNVDKKEEVVKTINDTFNKAAEDGFEAERIEAILHRIELSLKEKNVNFGVNLIMSLVPFWNHSDDDLSPCTKLRINEKLERFRNDLKTNPDFLKMKVKQYFVENKHKLTLTMIPKDSFVHDQNEALKKVEQDLVSKLSVTNARKMKRETIDSNRKNKIRIHDDLTCLPTLKASIDIPGEAPKEVFEDLLLNNGRIRTQISIQPTNEVAYFRALLDMKTLTEDQLLYLPLFVNVLSSLGAGDLDFRSLGTEIDLRTGGLNADVHIAENPDNADEIRSEILLSSFCLERNSDKMLELWGEIFNGVHFDAKDRLSTLISMLANDVTNSVVYNGHTYAMTSAASNLRPGSNFREKFGGLTNSAFLNKLAAERTDLDRISDSLRDIGNRLLNRNSLRIGLNSAENHSTTFMQQTEDFISKIPDKGNDSSSPPNPEPFESKARNTYFSAQFPIHFCSTSVSGVHYNHPDFAALKILARIVSLKYLHPEIREIGGAYGSGISPSAAGTISFYSYRDPNSARTLETFDKTAKWVENRSIDENDLNEAKLGVFKALDAPVMPGNRGMRRFLAGIDDDSFDRHRNAVKSVSADDVKRVAAEYLQNPARKSSTIIGPEKSDFKDLEGKWTVKQLMQ